MLPGWQRRLRQSHRLRGGASDHLWQTVSTSASSCSHHRRRQRGSVVLMVPPPRSLPPMTCSAESGRRKNVPERFFRASHWLLRPLHFRKPHTLTASPAGSYYVNFTNSRATTLASRAKRRCPEGQAGRINPSRVQGSLRRVVARRACYSVGDSHWVPPRPRRSLARRPSCGCQNHRGGAATACVAVACRSCCRRKSFSLR